MIRFIIWIGLITVAVIFLSSIVRGAIRRLFPFFSSINQPTSKPRPKKDEVIYHDKDVEVLRGEKK